MLQDLSHKLQRFLILSLFSVSYLDSIAYKQMAGSIPEVLSLGKGLPKGLAAEASTEIFLLLDFLCSGVRCIYQHKSIINRKVGSNINIPHLRASCLQGTSESVLEKLLDKLRW